MTTRDELVEVVARAYANERGLDWSDYEAQMYDSLEADIIRGMEAALKAINNAGLAVVPREPSEKMIHAAKVAYLGYEPDPDCWKWGDNGERVDRSVSEFTAALEAGEIK